jgi:hypothetical protein
MFIINIKIDNNSISYTVHPVPAPLSIKALTRSKINEGGSNQKLTLLSLGNAMSGLPNKIGTK